MPSDLADVNGLYEDALESIKKRKPVPRPTGGPSAAEQEQAAKDYYASVRTNVRALLPSAPAGRSADDSDGACCRCF